MKRVGPAAVSCVAAVALLTACGVRQSEVIEAGGPATVTVFPVEEQRMILFFVSSEGRLTPVSTPIFPGRDKEYAGPVPVVRALSGLFAGPSAEARAAGLHTELPPLEGETTVKSSSARVAIRVPFAVRGLGKTAVRQLVCTLAYTKGGDGTAEVTIASDDGTLPSAHCDA